MKNSSFLINSIRKSVFAKKKIIRLDELIITSQVLRINNHLEEKYFHVRTSPSLNETVGPVSRRRNDRGKGGWKGESSWKGRERGEREGRGFTKRFFAPYFLTRTSNRKHVRYLTETRWRRAYIIGSAYTDDDIDSLRSMKLAGGDDWGRRWQGCGACVRASNVCHARVSSLSLSFAISACISASVCLCAK